jgi:hypothetical protein
MAKWFKVDRLSYAPRIEEVEVTRETTHKIQIEGGRGRPVNKQTDWQNFFPTYLEARNFGREKLQREIEAREAGLDVMKARLERFKSDYP